MSFNICTFFTKQIYLHLEEGAICKTLTDDSIKEGSHSIASHKLKKKEFEALKYAFRYVEFRTNDKFS